jgi:predicted transcriptional regulator
LSSDNFNRLRTKELVALFPGIHLRELQRLLKTSFNTTRYHVHNLERDGEVLCSREAGYSRLFPIGFEESAKGLYSVLHSRITRQVLRALVDGRRLTNGEITAATGLPKSTVSEHIDLLCEMKLAKRSVTLGEGPSYEIQDQARVEEALALFERNLLTVAADSFIDLWDFGF